MVPWTLVLLISLFGLKWKKIHLLPEGASVGERLKKAWCKFRSQSPLQLFAWVVILTIFIFYCIPKSKRSVYLLPIYPFMGMLLAEYLLALVQRGREVFGFCLDFRCIDNIAYRYFLCRAFGHDSRKYLGNRQACRREYSFCECTAYGGALTAEMADCVPAACSCRLFAVYAGKACGHAFAVVWYGGCILCIFVSLDGVYQPTILAVKSDRHLAVRLNELEPQGMVYSYADWVKFYGINYYLGDRVRIFDKLNPAQGYVLVTDELQEQFLQDTENTYRVEEVYRTPLRSCDLRRKVIVYKFSKK